MSSRPHLRGTANAGSGGGNPVASRPIGSAALEPAHSDRSVETERPQHQNAGPHTKRPTSSVQGSTMCVEPSAFLLSSALTEAVPRRPGCQPHTTTKAVVPALTHSAWLT